MLLSFICLFIIISFENNATSEMTNPDLSILSGLLYSLQGKDLEKENYFERNNIKLDNENRKLHYPGSNNWNSNQLNKLLYWLGENDKNEAKNKINTEKRSAYRNFSKSFYINLLHKLNRAG